MAVEFNKFLYRVKNKELSLNEEERDIKQRDVAGKHHIQIQRS
jgi:hypothetical protein